MLNRFLLILAVVAVQATAFAQNWTPGTDLPAGRRAGALVYNNNYVYYIGGRPADEATSNQHAAAEVYYAAVNANGSIGAWSATTSLPGTRTEGGGYAYNGRIYYWGGWDAGFVTVNTCYYSTIQANGSLGPWTTSAVTIPFAPGNANPQMDSFGLGLMGYDKYIYVVGGENNAGEIQPHVYVSAIQASGDFGPWAATTALPVGDWFHGLATFKSPTMASPMIYMVGGNHGGTSEAHIYTNTINMADGTLGTWATDGIPLNQAAYELGVAVSGNSIWAIGGLTGATPLDNVQRIDLNQTTGLVSAVTALNPLPATRARTNAVGYSAGGNSYVLVAAGGGYSSADPVLASTVYSQVPLASVSDWTLY